MFEYEQAPLPTKSVLRALARCVATTAVLLTQRRIHLPDQHIGMRLRFADGTSAGVYRETVIDRVATQDPCVLMVEFSAALSRTRVIVPGLREMRRPVISSAGRRMNTRSRREAHGARWSCSVRRL
jgi:hypothetical protein